LSGTVIEQRTKPFSEIKKGYTWFSEEDVLFAKITPCMQNGKIAIARGLQGGFGFGTTEFHVLRPKEGIIPEIIWHYLRQPQFLDKATDHFTGAVGQQRLPADYLANLEMPLPSLPEQKRIATILKEQMAAVEKARVAAEARLEAASALVESYYREAFGNTPAFSATPIVPTRPVRDGWCWNRLTGIARLATGHTPSRYHSEYWNGDVPWLQLADIRALDGKEAFDTIEHTNPLGIENSASVILPKGTVCMSRTASVGFFTIMGRDMATSQDFVNWVCTPEFDPWFLMHLLISCRKQIRELGSGAVHNTIYFPTVQAFSVCVPPLSEQKRIASNLKEQMAVVEKAKAAAEAELETINALPAVLLCRAFNGEL